MGPILVSPTEPAALKAIGHVTWLPERMGCDVLLPHAGNFHGIQRKELSDLLASLHDGRLAKELGQMSRLTTALLIVEGKARWTLDGELILSHNPTRWTKTQHRNLLRSVQGHGVWVEQTESLAETIEAVRDFDTYIRKPDHQSLRRRPGPESVWGKAGSREWASHLLQGFPGVGPTLADNVIDHFNGVPLGWTVAEKDMGQVPGMGKKRVRVLYDALTSEGVTNGA